MKVRRLYFLILLCLLLTGACTRNDGDIGRQFGLWKLVSVTRAGVDDPSYEENVFWAFQNNTIEMKEVQADNVVYQSFGSYRIEDNTLFLSFTDPDFPPRPVTGLPRVCELDILRFTRSELVLSYQEGTVIYTFHKW